MDDSFALDVARERANHPASMHHLEIAHQPSDSVRRVVNAARRLPWIYEGITARKAHNLARAALAFVTKSESSSAFPPILKIDLSPVCNLSCPTCVHADPGDSPLLKKQRFASHQRMSVAQLERIVKEVSGYTCAASLYYLGDPLTHPDLDEMCRVARAGALNVHVSSNFSFVLSDDRIRSLLTCGITHLTVCVDGLTQETYSRTRRGGRIECVLDNLERLTKLKSELGLSHPRIEAQFLKFQHNQHEVETARALFERLGVDQVFFVWGDVHNYADVDVDAHHVADAFPDGTLPRCWWPYGSMLIRHDGEVIPCCSHRTAQQYAIDGQIRSIGSVFETGVAAVWGSEAYARTRRMAVSTRTSSLRGESRGHFCEGCSRLYRTDRATRWRSGHDHDAPPLVTLRRRDRTAHVDERAG